MVIDLIFHSIVPKKKDVARVARCASPKYSPSSPVAREAFCPEDDDEMSSSSASDSERDPMGAAAAQEQTETYTPQEQDQCPMCVAERAAALWQRSSMLPVRSGPKGPKGKGHDSRRKRLAQKLCSRRGPASAEAIERLLQEYDEEEKYLEETAAEPVQARAPMPAPAPLPAVPAEAPAKQKIRTPAVEDDVDSSDAEDMLPQEPKKKEVEDNKVHADWREKERVRILKQAAEQKELEERFEKETKLAMEESLKDMRPVAESRPLPAEAPQQPQVPMCSICLDVAASMIYIPCGHLCACPTCSAVVRKRCPLCKAAVASVHKVYM